MSVLYGGVHVDEQYSALFEPNLYPDRVFAPGVTFTDKYEEMPGGGVGVRQVNSTACAPGTPGRDFNDEATSTSLISVVLNNNFQKSKKMYNVALNNISGDLADEQLAVATEEVGTGWEASGLACLISEAGTTASLTTTALTTANIKKSLVADRKAIRDAHGKADVVLMSTDAFAKMLEVAGTQYTPIANDAINASGQVGKYLGMTIIECDGLSATNGAYYNGAGNLTTATFSSVDYIMYNKDAFSILTNLEAYRLIESENFVGVKAQVEVNSGYKVTSPVQVVCKKH